MTDPIAAVAAAGAAPSSRVPPASDAAHAMDPSLRAYHDAAGAKDFAALAAAAPPGAASRSPSFFAPIHDSVRTMMAGNALEIAQSADIGPITESTTQLEIAERTQRATARNTQLTASLAMSQIEFSFALAMSNSILDTTHSLLKSNE